MGLASEDIEGLGPAMLALRPMQRAYVRAMAADPFGNPTRWARAAGYSDHLEACKVRAHYLSHDPRIEAAVQEYSRGMLGVMGAMLAAAGLLRIARDPKHPKHFAALESLADRVGVPRTTEQRVAVEHTDRSGAAMIERIKQLARFLGVPAEQLLGPNAVDVGGARPSKMIEGRVINEPGDGDGRKG